MLQSWFVPGFGQMSCKAKRLANKEQKSQIERLDQCP